MGYCIDTVGSTPIETNLPPPVVRSSSSPSLTDPLSEDEVIVFSGRNSKTQRLLQGGSVGRNFISSVPDQIVASQPPKTESSVTRRVSGEAEEAAIPKTLHDDQLQATIQEHPMKHGRSSKRATKDDEALADYLANLQANDSNLESRSFPHPKLRDLDKDMRDHEYLERNSGADDMQDSNDEWDSVDMQDFDGFSTSSEMMDATPRILAKRLRNRATQYLVTLIGESVDEARWLPPALLKAPNAAASIALFEDHNKAENDCPMDDSDVSDGSSFFEYLLSKDLAKDQAAAEEEESLEKRRKARMSDEQIARLLSKQAELGIKGDELVLFTGESLTPLWDGPEQDSLYENLGVGPRRSPFDMKAQRKKKRFDDRFSSASVFADTLGQDPYDGFDIMDHERPSLRKKLRKGGPADTRLDVSDSDLQQSLQTAWENDRTKKKHRKQEREERRAQGLLTRTGKPDLKARFPEGMAMADVKNEIKAFMKSSAESQSLPPMGHNERKAVHNLANQIALKSKSMGSGNARFTILYKTSRTKALTADSESRVDTLFTPTKFLPRLDKARRRTAPPTRPRNAGLTAAASYRDGEIVGIGAPELGIDNRGRAMLEKMGWSTGTTLGAVDNKGISQPIAQAIKTSKAGLG